MSMCEQKCANGRQCRCPRRFRIRHEFSGMLLEVCQKHKDSLAVGKNGKKPEWSLVPRWIETGERS